MEIQDIKNQNLICLDFDDCIIEYATFREKGLENNSVEFITEKLKENVLNLNNFCKKHNYKVFITSSWSPLINDDLTINGKLDDIQKEWWDIIKNLPIIGKDPFKDREIAMDVLLENNNKIICIDDWDLEPHFEFAGDAFTMINIFGGRGWQKLKKVDDVLSNL